ncbi:hypothetical protein FACS1894145_4040 [Bacteroidia bacterium]|nr:hypothetical protein FACS189446_0870 [Bacteroidia bacterium]GHU79582.1 hypothetical protein FACS1894145_4040 [Bacteroidia bacterium]
MYIPLCAQKITIMKVITTREIRNNTKTYFELAEEERISVKRGKKYINLVVSKDPDEMYMSENWVKEFFAIPQEYRCNPFDTSPSGDLFWADKRNVEQLDQTIENSKTTTWTRLKKEDQKKFLGLE